MKIHRYPLLGLASGIRACVLALPLAAGATNAQEASAPPQAAMVERYVEAFNTGEPDRLAMVIADLYAPGLLEDFGGARAAGWDRIELFRTYGPLSIQRIDEEAEPPIVWSLGTVTGGWVGHQFHLTEASSGPPRVARHTTWRARPVPYPERALTEVQVADSMHAWLARLAAEGLFSGSVTMSREGKPVLSVSYGTEARGQDPTPITADTRFHIASVTKIITATALLGLVEDGRVGLDDPLSRWIPEYPRPWRDRVTVRHLLTHSSGIELDEDPEYLAKVRTARSVDDLLAAQIAHLAGSEPRFPPGSDYDYTSEGFDLLGVILERATGEPWTDVVRERVLEPAGMERTRFDIPQTEGDWALGFTSLNPDLQGTTPGALRPATEVLTDVAKPSSGAWSASGDLHSFMRALLEHRLLGPAWTDSLLTPERITAELPKYGIVSWVGLGAQGEDLWGVRTVGHGGVVPGYSAAIEYLPANNWLLTVVSNTGEATGFLVFQRFLELTAHAASDAAAADTSLAGRLRAYFAPLARAGDFSGGVVVARGDSVLYREAFGLASHELGVPNTPATRYQIASLTKTFTAAAIAILAERGALALDDPLSRFISAFPNAERMSIRQLLRHEAGLANPDYVAAFSDRIDLSELVRRIGERPPLFEPGSRGAYSNAGYNILARVVEVASGLGYEEFLHREIFEPLGLAATSQASWTRILLERAEPYLPGPAPSHVVNAPRADPGFAIGSGSLWSSVDDLLRWGRAVQGEALFDRDRLDYPHGWGRLGEDGAAGLRQTGLATGYTSSLSVWFADSLVVAILGNIELADWSRWPDDVAAIVRGEPLDPPELRPMVAAAPPDLAALAGTYATDEHTIGIEARDGALWLTLDDWPVPKFLAPTPVENLFLLRSDFGRIHFHRPPGAPARALEWVFGPESSVEYPRTEEPSKKQGEQEE